MRRRFFHSRKPLSPGSRVILFLTGLIVSIFLLDLRVRPNPRVEFGLEEINEQKNIFSPNKAI